MKESYPTAEMHSIYSKDPAKWTKVLSMMVEKHKKQNKKNDDKLANRFCPR